jgi:hypothetical protein
METRIVEEITNADFIFVKSQVPCGWGDSEV